ncbi:MAG TPA: YibE/F family protein [Frankiaceae bacterium]|nr:YibE/F family protein [Frankiaceae bacterium]
MGHGHGHAPAASSPRVRRLLLFALAPFAVLTLLGLVLLWPGEAPAARDGLGVATETVRGTVESTEAAACDEAGGPADQPLACTRAQVRLTSGPDRSVVPLVLGNEDGSLRLKKGMKLVLGIEPSAPVELRYRVVDVQRGRPLLVLALLFAAAVVGLGRWRGLAALAGLAISLGVLVKFVLPAFLEGASPLPVAVVGAAAIMFVAVYLAHGFTVRTSVAVLGTLVSLVLTGVLAAVFVAAGDFTGIATEEASFIRAAYGQVDVHGLLLAGIVIGSLGVLDDVTVTQASAIWELRAANPGMTPRELYGAGVRIGRDHIASTVNTLVLAYAGASLPLLLLFAVSGVGVGAALTSEVIAQEVVRTLVGSIGLVASVPVTTALAAYVATRDAGWTPPRDADDEWLGKLREVSED